MHEDAFAMILAMQKALPCGFLPKRASPRSSPRSARREVKLPRNWHAFQAADENEDVLVMRAIAPPRNLKKGAVAIIRPAASPAARSPRDDVHTGHLLKAPLCDSSSSTAGAPSTLPLAEQQPPPPPRDPWAVTPRRPSPTRCPSPMKVATLEFGLPPRATVPTPSVPHLATSSPRPPSSSPSTLTSAKARSGFAQATLAALPHTPLMAEWERWACAEEDLIREATRKQEKRRALEAARGSPMRTSPRSSPRRSEPVGGAVSSRPAVAMCSESSANFAGRPRLAPSPRFKMAERLPLKPTRVYPCSHAFPSSSTAGSASPSRAQTAPPSVREQSRQTEAQPPRPSTEAQPTDLLAQLAHMAHMVD